MVKLERAQSGGVCEEVDAPYGYLLVLTARGGTGLPRRYR